MREFAGFAWPDTDREAALYIVLDAVLFLPGLLEKVPGRSVAVQAGGNVGVYPLALAKVFKTVFTFEPEPANWECLVRNIGRYGRDGWIVPHNAALGAERGTCGLAANRPDNTGTWHMAGEGSVAVTTIDATDMARCDLIWLDIEGYEQAALAGAERTIERFAPAVIIEENGLAGTSGQGDASGWLRERGYSPILKLGNDSLYLKET